MADKESPSDKTDESVSQEVRNQITEKEQGKYRGNVDTEKWEPLKQSFSDEKKD